MTDRIEQYGRYIADAFWMTFLGTAPRRFPDTQITVNLEQLAASPKEYARIALDTWAEVSNLTFVEVDGPAQITFRVGDRSATFFAMASEEDGIIHSADVQQSNWLSLADHRHQIQDWIHELGHALGFGHTGPFNGNVGFDPNDLDQATEADSVMAYLEPEGDAIQIGLGPSDVWAVHYKYGKPEDPINPYDDIYRFAFDETGTIVDEGGTDMVFAEGDGVFDLTPGARNNAFSIYPDTIIEDLTVLVDEGYKVRITGNGADNTITILEHGA